QPDNAEMLANRGKVYAKLHNFPAALEDLSRSLELADHADTYYTRGLMFARQDDYENARRDLEKSLELAPQQQHVLHLLAQVIHQLDGLEAAQPYFEEAARAGSREAAQHLAVLRYQHRSDLRQQIDALSEEEAQERLAMLPSNAQGSRAYERGLLLLRMRRFDEAVAQLDRFIAENPRAGYGYSERARAHEQRGEYAAALDDCNRAIEHNPGDPALFVLRARIYQHLEQPQDARYDLNNAILLNPGYAVAYRLRALILRDQGELENALEDFIRAAELGLEDRVHEDIQTLQAKLGQVVIEPGESTIPPEESGGLPVAVPFVPAAPEGDAEMYYNRAVLQFERNNHAAAMEDVKRAIELDPNFGKAYSLRAVLYSLRGEKEREKQDAIRGMDLNPRLKELMQRGAQLTMEKQHEEGLRVLDEALELDPYCTMLYFSRATALMELGRDQEILENAKRARKLGLPNLEIMAAMGQIKRQQENPGKFAFDTIQAADTKDALQEIMRNNTNLLEPPMIAEVYQYAHRTIPAENARSWESFRERMEWLYQIGAFFLENPRTDQERDEALEAFLKLRSPQEVQQWLNQYPFATGFQFRQQLRRRAKEEQTSGILLPLLNQLDQYSASQPPAAAMYRFYLGLAAFHRAQNRDEMGWAVEDHPVLASNVKAIQQMISQQRGTQREELQQRHKWLREVTGNTSLWDRITGFLGTE
ncbi:MAG: tetratricopeptide repeat protein, partial [Anaerolineae bacterium]|nr:tetratricopeptide repeat protein [Anaerolineae bacterium]